MSLSCVCCLIDNTFGHNIVKIVCGSTLSYFDNVLANPSYLLLTIELLLNFLFRSSLVIRDTSLLTQYMPVLYALLLRNGPAISA